MQRGSAADAPLKSLANQELPRGLDVLGEAQETKAFIFLEAAKVADIDGRNAVEGCSMQTANEASNRHSDESPRAL